MQTLRDLGKNLALSPEMVQRAQEIYNEVSAELEIRLAPYSPDIYVQGSFALGTSIQPIAKDDEYDLDFVCLLRSHDFEGDPVGLKGVVGHALQSKYSNVLKEKQRCWRLCFANFHVDILPAIPETQIDENYGLNVDRAYVARPIRIPDKKLLRMKSSNPQGFAAWFRSRVALSGEPNRVLLKDSVQEMPTTNAELSTLQLAVMLLKRHRDQMFGNDEKDVKPISVIISTLAGDAYTGENNLLIAISQIVSAMPDRINSNRIINPANPKENFADKWIEKPEKKAAFNRWLSRLESLVADTNLIADSSSSGTYELNNLLSEHFSPELASAAIRESASSIAQPRKDEKLGVSAAGVVSVGGATPIKKNTFYGE